METIKTREALLERISASIGKTKVLQLSNILHHSLFDLHDAMALTFYHEKDIAFRAAWLLENMFVFMPDWFANNADKVITSFITNTNPSCQRHYTKILMHLTDPKADEPIRQKMLETDLEPAAERCFDLLIDPKSPIAVKAFACEVLFNLRDRYTWIKELLPQQIELLMDGGKPAIRSKGKKILQALQSGR